MATDRTRAARFFTTPLIAVVLVLGAICAFTAKAEERGYTVTPVHGRPDVSVSKSTFAACRDCRSMPDNAADCTSPVRDSFVMTYVVGEDEHYPRASVIRVLFAYKYNGEYLTFERNVKPAAWAEPNVTRPNADNYVWAEVVSADGAATALRAVVRTVQPLRAVDIELARAVPPGSHVRVFFGNEDASGYIVPALAYDVDLVVQNDLDGDGEFATIDATMPTLRVVGTELDAFNVVAPSMPSADSFTIIVQALEGEDTPTTNRYRVQNYAGTIRFSSTDAAAKLPADYTFDPADGGVKRFSVSLATAGAQHVFAEDVRSGHRGRSNPILVGNRTTGIGVAATGVGDPDYRLFWGVLQQHTSVGGHGQQSPEFAVHYAENIAGLEFFALTEHCDGPVVDFGYNWRVVDAAHQENQFVTFPAYEWSSRKYGHRHVIFYGNTETVHCDRQGPPGVGLITELAELLDIFDDKQALAIPHHSAWTYNPDLAQPDDDFVLGNPASRSQRLFEIYSHHGSSEMFDSAPYRIHLGNGEQWNEPDKLAYYRNAIAAGYKLGVVAGTDNHFGTPGGSVSPNSHYSRTGLTGVYADGLTRSGVWEALQARRTYGTTGARIVLAFYVSANGYGHDDVHTEMVKRAYMGSEISIAGYPTLHVTVEGTSSVSTIEIIRNGLETVYSSSPRSRRAEASYTDKSIKPGVENSFYVRVVQEDQHIAWSSPIWVTVDGPSSDTQRAK